MPCRYPALALALALVALTGCKCCRPEARPSCYPAAVEPPPVAVSPGPTTGRIDRIPAPDGSGLLVPPRSPQ
jgi:hypothetical protein